MDTYTRSFSPRPASPTLGRWMMENKRYMNHKETAIYLGISGDSLHKLAQRRMVPYGKRGNRLVFDKHNLDEWMSVCHKKQGVTLEEAIDNHIKKGGLL